MESAPTHKQSHPVGAGHARPADVYKRQGQRLLEVIRHNRGGANKDLAKFASQIAALCDKWDR